MPTYEYACAACQHHWEELQKISEPALDTCPKCGEKRAQRLISGGSFILKGGGWYADLYSSSGKSSGGSSGSSGSSSDSKSGGESSSAPAAAPAAPAPAATPSKKD
ncbi:MAG: zinc ribbon domain-containing protein [Polyangiaceae bacterium]|nr:zinc ribbon domain-containing protein [Polyangiaceae bacterium]